MAKEPSVAVLMSTYNGERFLDDQIKSIINQSYSNWHLYIRDDGSTDNTVKIIRKYSSNYKNISFVNQTNEPNLGIVHSFIKLLEMTQADFYMFSDQDDYWKYDKIEDTLLKMLEQNYQNIPICVHTNLSVVDETLKHRLDSEPKRVWTNFLKVLFSNCVTGCTAMINEKLKRKICFKKINYQRIVMHDWWLALVASQFGKLVYLNKSTILYRQHGNNVDGSQKRNTICWIMYRLTHYDHDRQEMCKMVRMAAEFYDEYGNELTGRDKEYVKNYGELMKISNPLHNFWLIIKLPPKERTFGGNLFLIYLMIIFYKDLLKIN